MSLLYNITKNIGGFIVTTYNSESGGSITNSEKARKSWIEWHFTEEDVIRLQITINYPEAEEPTVYMISFEELLIDSVKCNTQDLISEVLTNFLNSPMIQLGDLENVRIKDVVDGEHLRYRGDYDYWYNSER